MRFQISPNEAGILSGTDDCSLENAIAEASRFGVNRILIPAENERTGENKWILSRSLRIPSNFTVELDGCTLEAKGFPAFVNENFDAMPRSLATEDHNIVISGKGTLISGGVKFSNVKDFRLAGIRVEGAPCGIELDYCYSAFLDDLSFEDCRTGLCLANGVHDLVIERLSGKTKENFILIGEADAPMVTAKRRNINDLIFTGINAQTESGALAAFRALREGEFRNVLLSDVRVIGKGASAVIFSGGEKASPICGVTLDAFRCAGMKPAEIHTPLFQCAFMRLEKGSGEKIALPEEFCKEILVQEEKA